jgi:hypothetical protein
MQQIWKAMASSDSIPTKDHIDSTDADLIVQVMRRTEIFPLVIFHPRA